MTITAKLITTEKETSTRVELFTTKTAITADDKEIEVLQSLGTYEVENLESEKANLLKEIASIDEKIAAIKAITK